MDAKTFAEHFSEWHANHFEDFDDETNKQLLCLANEADELKNAPKPRIVIVMDGGLIQDTLANTANLEIALIDYDVEGADEDRLSAIPQQDKIGVPTPTYEQAYCWTQKHADEIDPARVDELFEAISGNRI